MRYTAIPQVGADRQRAEKSDAAPTRYEVGSYEFSSQLGCNHRGGVCEPTRPDVIRITHKCQRIRQAKKRAEREPKDSVRSGKIFFAHRAEL